MIDQLSRWIQTKKGLYVFSSDTKNEQMCENLIQFILGDVKLNVHYNTYKTDLSHCNKITNSIFVDDIMDIKKSDEIMDIKKSYVDLQKSIEKLIDAQRKNENTQIIKTKGSPTYKSFGGNILLYESLFFGVITNNKLNIVKIRHKSRLNDINLITFFREQKISKLIE